MQDPNAFASFVLDEFAELRKEGQQASQPPPPASRNSELLPKLDSQVAPRDMRENPPLQDGAQFTGFEFELPEEPEGYEWFPDASVGQGSYILIRSSSPFRRATDEGKDSESNPPDQRGSGSESPDIGAQRAEQLDIVRRKAGQRLKEPRQRGVQRKVVLKQPWQASCFGPRAQT